MVDFVPKYGVNTHYSVVVTLPEKDQGSSSVEQIRGGTARDSSAGAGICEPRGGGPFGCW